MRFQKVCVVLLLWVSISFPAFAEPQETVRVGIFAGVPWATDYSIDGGEKTEGVVPRFWKEVSARSGLKLKTFIVPYKRMLSMLDAGGVDYAIFFRSEKSEQRFVPLLQLTELQTIILTDQKGKEITFEDLYDYRIAGKHGVLYGTRFDNDQKLKKYTAKSYSNVVKMLEEDRVNAIIGSAVSLKYHLKRSKINVTDLSKPFVLKVNRVFLHASKSNNLPASTRDRLLQTISELVQENYYRRMINNSIEALHFQPRG